MKELRGAHVVLTGASRGLGVVIAEALAGEGANLTLAARSAGELAVTKQKVEQRGGRAVVVPTDVTAVDDRTRLVASAVDAFGPVDVLVNNAGLEWAAWFTELDPAEVERIVSVNLTAALLLAQLVLPAMVERRQGHIVNIASTAGKGGAPFETVYSATKGGLVMASRALRAELAGTGVHVSVVCPGFVDDVGMYERQSHEFGVRASRWIGLTTSDKVAGAVVRALRRESPELVVNSRPLRPLLALAELFPALAAPVTNWLVYPMLRAVADERRRLAAPANEVSKSDVSTNDASTNDVSTNIVD